MGIIGHSLTAQECALPAGLAVLWNPGFPLPALCSTWNSGVKLASSPPPNPAYLRGFMTPLGSTYPGFLAPAPNPAPEDALAYAGSQLTSLQ